MGCRNVDKGGGIGCLYVQPIAQHHEHPERLLLKAEDGRAYVWLGEDPDGTPEEIEPATATWLLTLPSLRQLSQPRVWFQVTDLPVATRVA